MAVPPTEPLPRNRGSDPVRRDPTAVELAALPADLDPAAAEAWCRAVTESHYENFTVASRLAPRALRQDLANVYAFARWSDDLADEAPTPEAAGAALADWRRRLERCFEGRPDHPVFVALGRTVARHRLPIDPFARLLDAFDEDRAFDASGTLVRYASREELVGYCSRSADPVGRIVLALGGCRDPAAVASSDRICTGLQLVNFWQDVRRDRLAGRVYFPAEDMARHGVDVSELDGSAATPAYRALVRDEVAWARSLFDGGAGLVRTAPKPLRAAIGLFLAGGRAVADCIEAAGHDTLRVRPTLGRMRKARLAARAMAGIVWNGLTGA